VRKLSLAAAFFAVTCRTAPPSPPVDLVVIAPHMLDVRSGNILENRAVVIRDGKITAVEDASFALRLAAKERVTLPDSATLLPGLIDAHTHLAWSGSPNEEAARATLMAGFTTVRNPGATGDADLVLRAAIEEGRVPGPRMLIARAGIGAKGGICESTFGESGVDSPDEARARVQKLVANGADLIKICTGGGVVGRPADTATTEMSPEVIRAIVTEAHRLGRKVAAHAQGPAAIRAAAIGGVDSVEHGGLIDDDAARLLAERHIVLVPTLARLAQNPRLYENTIARVRRARELGVALVLGTDGTVLPHGENAKEFDALIAVGMTPVEAIRAATSDAARLLGWDQRVGSIEPGFEADLVGVTSLSPVDVKLVIARGRVVRNDLTLSRAREGRNGAGSSPARLR
jgi:imidazolonepropionase-like amidohydrolase